VVLCVAAVAFAALMVFRPGGGENGPGLYNPTHMNKPPAWLFSHQGPPDKSTKGKVTAGKTEGGKTEGGNTASDTTSK